jgi:hypothetical protein
MSDTNRIGYSPIETVETYKFTTNDVRDFLQQRINMMINAARQKGSNCEDVQITLISMPYSKKFAPFVAVLPEEAIKKRTSESGDHVMKVFQNDENRELANLQEPVWDAVSSFVYVKGDKKAFLNSSDYKAKLGISTTAAREIAGLCSPKMMRIGDHNSKTVVFLIDPIRVFSTMVKKNQSEINPKTHAPAYVVEAEYEKIDRDNCSYRVMKKPRERKRNEGVNDKLSKILRGSLNRQ